MEFPSHWRLIPWPYRWLARCCRVCSHVWSTAAFLCSDWSTDAFFTIHGSRQATETKSHGQAAIRKRFSSLGPQEGECRLNSSHQHSRSCFFFLSSQHHDSNIVIQATKVGSTAATTKTQWEHTLHTLSSFWSANLLQRKPLNTHTLPAWFSACSRVLLGQRAHYISKGVRKMIAASIQTISLQHTPSKGGVL